MIKTSPYSSGLKTRPFELKPYQDKFIFTDARYPALISAWGTGKTMCGIMRSMILSEEIPENLGLIVRKEFTDLKDSTIKDFQLYTGIQVPSNKDVVLSNGSVIMFRHGDELDVLKNINLGWFLMEQAEEFESDEQFQYLRGRLRRANIPIRTGFIIGNVNSHNWIWSTWKQGVNPNYPLFEATSFDNSDILPPDTIEDWKEMEISSPNTFKRFVMNDWEAESGEDWIIPVSLVEKSSGVLVTSEQEVIKRLIVIDPARGGDEVVIYGMENTEIISKDVFTKMGETKTMEIVGRAMVMRDRIKASIFVVDSIGIGAGVCDRLRELKKVDDEIKAVIDLNSGSKSQDERHFFNVRAEMWWKTAEMFKEGKVVGKNIDEKLKKQLSGVKYEIMDSRGKIRIEPKDNIKSRLGCSPDRADAFVMGIYGLRFAPNLVVPKEKSKETIFWDRVRKDIKTLGNKDSRYKDDELGEV